MLKSLKLLRVAFSMGIFLLSSWASLLTSSGPVVKGECEGLCSTACGHYRRRRDTSGSSQGSCSSPGPSRLLPPELIKGTLCLPLPSEMEGHSDASGEAVVKPMLFGNNRDGHALPGKLRGWR